MCVNFPDLILLTREFASLWDLNWLYFIQCHLVDKRKFLSTQYKSSCRAPIKFHPPPPSQPSMQSETIESGPTNKPESDLTLFCGITCSQHRTCVIWLFHPCYTWKQDEKQSVESDLRFELSLPTSAAGTHVFVLFCLIFLVPCK